MSVLIDPYMFELSNTQEIKNNIVFFEKVIRLCNHPDKMQMSPIALYKGMIERLNQRSIQPFPIKMEDISDDDLRKTIMQINKSFTNALTGSIVNIDIEACSGDQEFSVKNDPEMRDDKKYFEMLSMLLIPCYSKHTDFDKRILTGNKKSGKQIGDEFELSCNCDDAKYRRTYVFAGIEEFISIKDTLISVLKKKIKNNEIPVTGIVKAEMGTHHNHVQANEKKFNSLDELSIKNKAVLKLLRELGLFKIVFGRFTPKGMKAVGTMDIKMVKEKETQDILSAKFYAETGFQYDTELYFPKGIGKIVADYFKEEQLTYKNVSYLIEKIK